MAKTSQTNYMNRRLNRASFQLRRFEAYGGFLYTSRGSIAADGPIVMVGRDIGTMVLPDATIKVYLVASPEARAMRRYEERKITPDSSAYEEVLYRLIHRDRIDSQRAESHPADDAVIIDTDNLDACETARRIIDLIEGA